MIDVSIVIPTFNRLWSLPAAVDSCFAAGGNVEVQSVVSHRAGKLTGSWRELVRDMSGDLAGTVTPRGFKVRVRGESLNANMDIILLKAKQVIEIQFINSSLIGLTLVLERG